MFALWVYPHDLSLIIRDDKEPIYSSAHEHYSQELDFISKKKKTSEIRKKKININGVRVGGWEKETNERLF